MPPQPGMGYPSDGPPRIVVYAILALAVLFLFGGIYLLSTNPFSGTQVIAPAELPEVTVAVQDYHGSILGMEDRRKDVKQFLTQRGLAGGDPITIFPVTPFYMRPIEVTCQVGYLLALGRPLTTEAGPVQIVKIDPGKRLVVRVKGNGNFTGNKAYKAAVRYLRSWHLRPGEGERFEVKVVINQELFVEHWIPVE